MRPKVDWVSDSERRVPDLTIRPRIDPALRPLPPDSPTGSALPQGVNPNSSPSSSDSLRRDHNTSHPDFHSALPAGAHPDSQASTGSALPQGENPNSSPSSSSSDSLRRDHNSSHPDSGPRLPSHSALPAGAHPSSKASDSPPPGWRRATPPPPTYEPRESYVPPAEYTYVVMYGLGFEGIPDVESMLQEGKKVAVCACRTLENAKERGLKFIREQKFSDLDGDPERLGNGVEPRQAGFIEGQIWRGGDGRHRQTVCVVWIEKVLVLNERV